MAMKIVILEDNEERRALMEDWLRDRFYQFEHRFFDNAPEAIRFLQDHLNETILICLDHDLEMKKGPDGTWVDAGTGRDVTDFLAQRPPGCAVVIHTTNSTARVGMKMVLQDAGWKTRTVIPFDDMAWIPSCWFPTIRRAILRTAKPVGNLPEDL